jgi:EpsI family protein
VAGPIIAGADRIALGRYRNRAGQEVDLAIVVFARQEEGRELVGYGQGAAAEDGAWSWTATPPPPAGGKAERIGSNGHVREVASFYRVGEILTGSPARVKLETVRVRLLGGPQRAVAVLVARRRPPTGSAPVRRSIPSSGRSGRSKSLPTGPRGWQGRNKMCGIAGLFHPDVPKPVDPARVRAMADALAHRGPDGSGVWTAPGIGLGHRRLSIIDLATGDQPMRSPDGGSRSPTMARSTISAR